MFSLIDTVLSSDNLTTGWWEVGGGGGSGEEEKQVTMLTILDTQLFLLP